MRRLTLLAFLLLIGGWPAFAQGVTGSITASATATGCSTLITTACIGITLPANSGSVGVSLTGNSGGSTYQFEVSTGIVSGGNITWQTASAFPTNSTTSVTSTTSSSGTWSVAVNGMAYFRIRCSTFVSGTTTVLINSSLAINLPSVSGGGGGGSGITALTGDVTASGTGSVAATVVGLNNVLLSSLTNGCAYLTAGVPSTVACLTTAANVNLSNLASVAVNLALTPGTDNSIALDSLTKRYTNLWLSSVLGWTNGSGTADTGLSRCGAGIVCAGNGTAGDTTGTLEGATLQSVSDGVHAGLVGIVGNTTAPTGLPSNSAGWIGPNSASFTSWFGQLPATGPSGTQYLGCGTPSSNISACAWSTLAASLDQVTGAAAQATGTETSAGHNYTFAGVETTALVAPFVFQDTNSSNSNTSVPLISNCAGTSIGCIGFISNTVTGTAAGGGDIFRGYFGATVANGTLTGGTLEREDLANGEGLFGASAPNLTLGTSGGWVATEGTAPTTTSTQYGMYNDSTNHCPTLMFQATNEGCAVAVAGAQTLSGAKTFSGGVINTTTPVRDETRFVLVSNMTAVATAGVNIGSTGASNATFSWPVTAANWYDLQCKLPVTFATTATIKFQLVSISGSVTVSNVNADTMGNTGAAGVFQDLATVAGTTLATSVTPVTGAPGASEQINYSAQFLTSHAGNIGLEFIANGTNNVTMLLGGECGITQIN